MREILFRGKRLDNGLWIEGWYGMQCFGSWPLRHAIAPSEEAKSGCLRYEEIDPATLGQYTGQKDKNGKKIFEGDIVLLFEKNSGVVVYDDNSAGYAIPGDGCGLCVSNANERIVIGNIHDNPELLGGESDG